MPNRLPEVEYDESEIVRRVSTTKDYVSFRGRLGRFRWPSAASVSSFGPKPMTSHYGIFFGSRRGRIYRLERTNNRQLYVPEHLSAMSPD